MDDVKPSKLYRFTYDYDEMIIGNTTRSTTTAVMLVHPIGVGIGRWYYNRLLQSLRERYGDIDHRLVFLAPDLLGSATASGPVDVDTSEAITKVPLLNITDWTSQVSQLMAEYEAKNQAEGHEISNWSVVTNGGCSPIALQVASNFVSSAAPFQSAISNVVISSPPRLPFFLEGTDPSKVRKSYRTLSGVVGKLFWWYSLRKDGRFVQKFSEKNLVGDPASLGEEWKPNCLKAARLHDGRSRYSTFSFLAGTLQDGCLDSLKALKGSNVKIDFIRGSDKRRNRAKSWFWSRKKRKVMGKSGANTDPIGATENSNDDSADAVADKTIAQYVQKNGNGGKELYVGGRISLAWEDSSGYAKSLMKLMCD